MVLPERRRSLSMASASSEHSRWPPSARLSTRCLPNDAHSYSATSSGQPKESPQKDITPYRKIRTSQNRSAAEFYGDTPGVNLVAVRSLARRSLRVAIQLHYDLRRTRSIFGTFVAHPKMRWRKSEPEKGLRIKMADDIQNPEVRDHFEFVAVELTRGSSHVFFPSIFETDAVHAWLIAQKVYRKRCDPIEWKKPKNSGDALDG